MKSFQKSESIKAGLRKSFQDGSSKMARRRCYGYQTAPDGTLVIDPQEAEIVIWIFQQYKAGKSLGKIAAGLEKQGIPSCLKNAVHHNLPEFGQFKTSMLSSPMASFI